MPDRDVETIRDLIYYQYAKIIACRAFGESDGAEVKRKHYGFVKQTFRKLKCGEMAWSDILREDWQLMELGKQCVYCGADEYLDREHIVPRSLRIKPDCGTCDIIQGIHNQVLACKRCNAAKGAGGLYEFYREKYPREKRYYDIIPPLVEKKYLKTILQCHICAGTLDVADTGRDWRISVLDIDSIIR